MKISSRTKIADLIKENGEAIEAIASINPHFNKLRNPILRKILGSRVSIADAARIGKCSVELFFSKLEAIGFEIDSDVAPSAIPQTKDVPKEIRDAILHGRIIVLDVRESISRGIDPFVLITDKLKTVPVNHVLLVINSFEPVPLIRIMEKLGSATAVETRGAAVYTYFTRNEEPVTTQGSGMFLNRCTTEELREHAKLFQGRIREVDVREMEMPLPMVTILEELAVLPPGGALFVNHKKVPQHLLPELESRLCKVWIAEIEEGNVKLLITK